MTPYRLLTQLQPCRDLFIRKVRDPVFTNVDKETVRVSWPLSQGGALQIELKEQTAAIKLTGDPSLDWYLDLDVAPGAKPPFTKIAADQLECSFESLNYKVSATSGKFSTPSNGAVFRLQPQKNTIFLRLAAVKNS